MTSEELFEAILSDTFNVVNSVIPVPKELIKWVYRKMKKNPSNIYLDMNQGKILNFYKREKDKVLKLNFNGQTEFLPQYIEIDNTSSPLDMSHFLFKFDESVYNVPLEIKDYTSEAFSKLTRKMNYTNEENLRLSNLSFENNTYTFHTQPVYYQCYLRTNMLMDYAPTEEDSLRKKLHSDGKIELFQESKLANHIGINILLFTPAGYLILPKRSNKVSYAPSELSASISGAVSSNDVSDEKSLNYFSIIREGIEELGLKRNDIIKESVQFLGLTRELLRGGKPEIFFIMQTKLTKDEIKKRWSNAKDKWENKNINYYPFGSNALKPLSNKLELDKYNEMVNILFDKLGKNMSLPLITNLALWIKYKRNGN